jgi:hypothetical protein
MLEIAVEMPLAIVWSKCFTAPVVPIAQDFGR